MVHHLGSVWLLYSVLNIESKYQHYSMAKGEMGVCKSSDCWNSTRNTNEISPALGVVKLVSRSNSEVHCFSDLTYHTHGKVRQRSILVSVDLSPLCSVDFWSSVSRQYALLDVSPMNLQFHSLHANSHVAHFIVEPPFSPFQHNIQLSFSHLLFRMDV